MNIQEDLKQVKRAFESDEKVLESAFRFEIFFRKNRMWILGIVGILILIILGYQAKDYLEEQKALEITSLFDEFQKNGGDEVLLKKIQDKNQTLYEFLSLTQAIKNQDKQQLELMQNAGNAFVSQYAHYQYSSLIQAFDQKNYGEFQDLALLQKGYLSNLNHKHQEALKILNEIPLTSNLRDLALRIGHYGITF